MFSLNPETSNRFLLNIMVVVLAQKIKVKKMKFRFPGLLTK